MIQIAGRVYVKRSAGSKLYFYDIHSEGTRLQVLAQADNIERGAVSFEDQHITSVEGILLVFVAIPRAPTPRLNRAAVTTRMSCRSPPLKWFFCHPAYIRSPTTIMALRIQNSASDSDISIS